ncbi:hypothetical protein MLD38_036393 [Melastoma candidum]|uniref:Uncharacterized protein n=1 Tax=Melastoma candidum TaxID=119954 RepID=A0ACB9LKR6_9MYRT|nr:hypothetical protein MLD38_036393 [Melastoma candidum]
MDQLVNFIIRPPRVQIPSKIEAKFHSLQSMPATGRNISEDKYICCFQELCHAFISLGFVEAERTDEG